MKFIKILTAYELGKVADETESSLNETNLLPTIDTFEIYIKEAVSVGLKAIDQGVTWNIQSEDEIYMESKRNIEFAQNQAKVLMNEGFIPPFTDKI